MPSKKLKTIKDDKKKEKPPVGRNKFTYIGSVIILFLVIVAFVLMPASGRSLSKRNSLVFGYYKGKPIEFIQGNYLHKQFLNLFNDAQNKYQTGQSQMDPANPYFLRQAWYRAYVFTVMRTALLDIADGKKVSVALSAVNAMIRETEREYMENGEFSPNLYQQTPRTEQNRILKNHSTDMLVDKTERDIISTARISDAEKEWADEIASKEKQFQIVSWKLSEYPEEEVVKYGNENSDLFRKISLSRITVKSDKSVIDDVYGQLMENNRLFEDLAKQHSTDGYKEAGGKMGWVYSYEFDTISKDDIAMIFNLAKEEISPIIENDYGWSIYRCDDSARDADLTAKEDLNKVRYYLTSQASGQIEDYFIAKAEEIRTEAKKTSLSSAARKFGKDVINTTFFPVVYGTDYVQLYQGQTTQLFKAPGVTGGAENILSSAATNQSFLEDLNAIAPKDISDPLISGQYVMLASLVEEKTVDTETLGFSAPSSLLTFLVQQYYNNDFYTVIMESDNLDDHFSTAVERLVAEENE